METTEKQVSMRVQSWIRRAQRKQPPKLDYHSELRSWLQHAYQRQIRTKTSTEKTDS